MLITDIDIEIFLSELEASKKKYGVLILGYVIMPNHVHLVLYKDDNLKFGSIIGEIKRKSAYKIITRWKSQDRTMLNQIMVPIGRKQKYAFCCRDVMIIIAGRRIRFEKKLIIVIIIRSRPGWFPNPAIGNGRVLDGIGERKIVLYKSMRLSCKLKDV